MNTKSRILVFDNYDSFTYNLVHIVKELGYTNVEVHRNDKITLEAIASDFDKIILSPGPGIPEEAGLLLDVIRTFAGKKSILGVCLGHQAIGQVFGGTLINLDKVYHGVATPVNVLVPDVLFEEIPLRYHIGRYHSWAVSTDNFPTELEITATDDEGAIMAMRHKKFDIHGVQFHPESVLTEHGIQLMKNWLSK